MGLDAPIVSRRGRYSTEQEQYSHGTDDRGAQSTGLWAPRHRARLEILGNPSRWVFGSFSHEEERALSAGDSPNKASILAITTGRGCERPSASTGGLRYTSVPSELGGPHFLREEERV